MSDEKIQRDRVNRLAERLTKEVNKDLGPGLAPGLRIRLFEALNALAIATARTLDECRDEPGARSFFDDALKLNTSPRKAALVT